jgi:hypothetical protein
VEHAVPFAPIRWRTAALVASGVAALELIVLIAAGVILFGHSLGTREAKAARQPAPARRHANAPAAHRALLPRGRTAVVVFNGNGRSGAAHAEAARVSARGYPISAVGNAPAAATGPTLVMYRPGRQAEAKRLARDLGISVVAPLDGLAPSGLHGAKLAVVLGY